LYKCQQNYAKFSNAIHVSKRSPDDSLSDNLILSIGIHSGKGEVKWYVNGLLVFSWNRIGYRLKDEYRLQDLGGENETVEISKILVGFGNFSLLDKAIPNDYSRIFVTSIDSNKQISNSALVQLEEKEIYKEMLRSLDGEERQLLNPKITFAYVLNETSNNNKNIKLFGQGSILKIKKLKIYSSLSNY
jgi:hypothetical protein